MVDVTFIRPLNKVKVHWPSSPGSAQTRQLSFLERGQNMATEALPSKTTVYLLSCELQTGSKIFNGECVAMIEWP